MPAASPKPSEDLLFSSDAGFDSHPASTGSGMSDERNADSVLFKLDNLKDIQRAEQQQRAASAPLARLAAPTPASGGSGLIDIKSLAGASDAGVPDATPAAPPKVASDGSGLIDVAKLADAETPSAPATSPDDALISRGTLSATMAPQVVTNPAPAQAPSRTPIIVLSVLTLLAFAAAVAAIVIRGL